MGLNKAQKQAVEHTGSPLLITAGPGTGKTRVIKDRIKFLLKSGLKPSEILCLTFSTKAAAELKTRLEQDEEIKGKIDISDIQISTYHAFCQQILFENTMATGLAMNKGIVDRATFLVWGVQNIDLFGFDSYVEIKNNASDIIEKMIDGISVFNDELVSPEELEKYVVKKLSGGPITDLDELDTIHKLVNLVKIYKMYTQFKESNDVMDFDDLICMTVELLTKNRDLQKYYSDRYRYLLIDEYQDTNRPQYDLIRQLTQLNQNITAVGDEDQSIYGFRGADVGNILRFEADFPGTCIVKLEQNYRSTQNILDAATGVISNNVERRIKTLWTEHSGGDLVNIFEAANAKMEALYVSQKVSEHLAQGDRPMGILYRTNFQSRQFEETLQLMKIPYKLVGGVSFYRRKEIKNALSYLQVVLRPNDNVSLMRVINTPPRGIGVTALGHLQKIARTQDLSLWCALEKGLKEKVFSSRIRGALGQFHSLITDCQRFAQLPLHLALEKILEESGYIRSLRQKDGEKAYNRVLNLEELIEVAREHVEQEGTLQEFLDQAVLRSEADQYDGTAQVSLMTLHNAKGLEFTVVFIVGCEEGLFPHSRSIGQDDLEEERRLCYVGMTRSREKLYLTYSRFRRFFGKEADEWNRPSRFLEEIPESLLENAWGGHSSDEWPGRGLDIQQNRTRGRLGYSGKTYDSVKKAGGFLQKLSRGKKKSFSGFVKGAQVIHHSFGRGKILQVRENVGDLKITVRFVDVGIKKLLQSYAKLKLL